jgi:ArsR family transcriptional regulator
MSQWMLGYIRTGAKGQGNLHDRCRLDVAGHDDGMERRIGMPQLTVDMSAAARVLKLLGDPTRLTILAILNQRECCVCELLEVFSSSQPAISQHLRKLKDAGLIQEERRGQWVYYSLRPQSEYYSLLQAVLSYVPNQDENIRKIEEANLASRCGC